MKKLLILLILSAIVGCHQPDPRIPVVKESRVVDPNHFTEVLMAFDDWRMSHQNAWMEIYLESQEKINERD